MINYQSFTDSSLHSDVVTRPKMTRLDFDSFTSQVAETECMEMTDVDSKKRTVTIVVEKHANAAHVLEMCVYAQDSGLFLGPMDGDGEKTTVTFYNPHGERDENE